MDVLLLSISFCLLKRWSCMAKKLEYVALLKSRIEKLHECEAVHRESVPVHETLHGQTIWKGNVEVFDVNGHAEAKICYAWSWDADDRGVRYVTILKKPPVNSPSMAVKSAIFFDAQPAPYPKPAQSG